MQKRVKTCKNVHLKYSFIKKTCKNVQKRVKTCISKVFGPNSKTCTSKVRAAWGRVSRGLTVLSVGRGVKVVKSEMLEARWGGGKFWPCSYFLPTPHMFGPHVTITPPDFRPCNIPDTSTYIFSYHQLTHTPITAHCTVQPHASMAKIFFWTSRLFLKNSGYFMM